MKGGLAASILATSELARDRQRLYGRIHASTISGGSQLSAYPGRCEVGIERCLVPGETVAQAQAELEDVLARAAVREPRQNAELQQIVGPEAMALGRSEPVVTELISVAARHLGAAPEIRGDMGWMDSGILVEAGIPCVAFGPTGGGEHTAAEWVDLSSVALCARVLADTARSFCV